MTVKATQSDFDSQHYRENSKLQVGHADRFIDLITVHSTDHIIDLGCGDGRLTAKLADLAINGEVLGIDISDSMIRLASSTFSSADYLNLRFLTQAAESMDYTNQFDLITCFSAVHWITDHNSFLIKVKKSLKKMVVLPFLPMVPFKNIGIPLIKLLSWSDGENILLGRAHVTAQSQQKSGKRHSKDLG